MNNYDVDVFMELTGLDITEDQLSAYERAQKRAFSMLENELGWSFKYSSQYEEVGKVKSVCSCPKFLKQIDEKDMLPADSVPMLPYLGHPPYPSAQPCHLKSNKSYMRPPPVPHTGSRTNQCPYHPLLCTLFDPKSSLSLSFLLMFFATCYRI